ncbi:hypothetical protein [Nostoc sp. C057]|nr:hypothetical protein [Nostoc sp. C057]
METSYLLAAETEAVMPPPSIKVLRFLGLPIYAIACLMAWQAKLL